MTPEQKQQSKEGLFTKIPQAMMEDPSFSIYEKFIYAHMLRRFTFFNGMGKEYFDNQTDIGKALNMIRQTVSSAVKSLEQKGLIETSKVKTTTSTGVYSSYKYIVIDKYKIYSKNVSKNTSDDDDSDLDLPF